MVTGVCVLVALIAAACTGSPSTGPRRSAPNTTATTASSTASTTTRPSASSSLAPYFTAVAEADGRLRAAATAANGAIGTNAITLSQSVLNTVRAADPSSAASLIPAGLAPNVLLPVLTLQSDLTSRFYAMRGFSTAYYPGGPTTILVASDSGRYLLTCLGNGGNAASLFSADLAAAETAAAEAPPPSAVDPASRTAADLAIWLQQINGANAGCESCGGARFTTLDAITWHDVAPLTTGGNRWDGDAGGLLFSVHYTSGHGWTVQLNAC